MVMAYYPSSCNTMKSSSRTSSRNTFQSGSLQDSCTKYLTSAKNSDGYISFGDATSRYSPPKISILIVPIFSPLMSYTVLSESTLIWLHIFKSPPVQYSQHTSIPTHRQLFLPP